MIVADVVFDVPLDHPFSYGVPPSLSVGPGQRVVAPLGRATRTGVVVAVREQPDTPLRSLLRQAEPAPALDAPGLALARWVAEQSLSSLGSTLAALLPPPPAPAAPVTEAAAAPAPPHLLTGTGRETRLLERLAGAPAALLIVPDVESAARWAQRLGKMGPTVRLDSGVDDGERAAGWGALATHRARLAVGTRSALLTPLPPGATLALLDEHESTYKPPGPPRLHSRDIVLARATQHGLLTVMTSATPSVEMWWRADSHRARLEAADPGPWPAFEAADTRGILRREALTPTLARAVRDTLAAGRRVLLVVSRRASALACDECGTIVRCPRCGIALRYARAARTLACHLCGASEPLPDTCESCRGRRLSPFGWGAERVEQAVRRRFPHARIARHEPEARGRRRETERAGAAAAQIVIGTRGALRLFGPGALGLAGFVSPDQLLRLPDFRAGERLFSLLWAAAERVTAGGALVVQSQTPEHYAVQAVMRQDLREFYRQELKFRGELGYPPFRRLAVLTVTAPDPAQAARLAGDVAAALTADAALTVYPATSHRRDRVRRIVVKGRDDLPARVATAVEDFRGPRRKSRGIMDVEVDPVEWPS